MDIVNCKWEIANLGERVCEVTLSPGEDLDFPTIDNLRRDFSYQVVKVPAGNVTASIKLQEWGFIMIEAQMDWIVKIKDFNCTHPLISRLTPTLSFEDIESEDELEKMLSHIDNNMFSTDRIALDTRYGKEVGRNRYCNWIRSEFEKRTSFIAYINYEGIDIGFLMLKVTNNRGHGALAGIFREYQNMGFGVLTSSSMPLYILRNNLSAKTYETSTSSNNTSNTKIYTSLGFHMKSMHYVFIKHV